MLTIKRLTQMKTIILDDFGLRNYTHEEANVLVDLLEDRHRKGSVIVTSQVDPRGWRLLTGILRARAHTQAITSMVLSVFIQGR